MSSQSIWLAYDTQLVPSIRNRLTECDLSHLWLLENTGPEVTLQLKLDKYFGNQLTQLSSHKTSSVQFDHYDPMRGDHQTIEKLNEFLENQSWRSAVDWTTTALLKNIHDYQIWFIRFACLMKLRMFPVIESELETFGNLNTYPKLPFSLRLLHAELPIYLENNRYYDALDRLFRLLMITNTIISVLPKDQASLWHRRRLRILYSISNCYLLMKRLDLFISTVENQLIKNETVEQQIELYLLMVRILLQTGDQINAQRAYQRALSLLPSKEDLPKEFLHSQLFLSIFRNEFYDQLSTLPIESDPISANNHGVLLLYLSKMRESLNKYESYIRSSKENIHEAIIYNMSTIYELESFRFPQKKQELIDYLATQVPDGFGISSLKLQT